MVLSSAPVTVVTAYYNIGSKFSSDVYVGWIRNFWPRSNCPLVFFTEPEAVQSIEQILTEQGRAKELTQVVGLPFTELTAVTALDPALWSNATVIDPDGTEGGHGPALYSLWYEKKEFVARAIQSNPFHSDFFVWCDAGICRDTTWPASLAPTFPLAEKIPRGRMLLLQIDPFEVDDWKEEGGGGGDIRGHFGRRATVGGGILASDREGWERWSKAYDSMLKRYVAAGRFIGKDQNIMASCLLEDPTLGILVRAPDCMGPIHKWFYLLFYLAGLRVSSAS